MVHDADLRALPGAASRAMWLHASRRVGTIERWKRNGWTVVCLSFRLRGRRVRIYSDVDRWGVRHRLTEETAQMLLDDIRAEVRRRRSIEEAIAPFLGASAPENLVGYRWDRFLEQKRRDARDGQITTRHLGELEGIERRGYLDPLLGRSIYELDYGALEDWLAWLADSRPHLSARSRKHALSAAMSLLRWLHRRRDLADIPEAPNVAIGEHAPTLLSADEREKILAAIPEAARGIFLALAHMGLRPSEARALDWSAYRDRYLTVAHAAKDQRTEGRIGDTKTRSVRRLPVHPEVAEWIEAHARREDLLPDPPLFRNPEGATASRRWSPSAMGRAWTRAQIKALGRKLAPLYEGTRHSFATLALNDGADQYTVGKFLGHRDPRTTERYAKLADSSLGTVLRLPRD